MLGRPPLEKNTGLLQEIEALSRALSLPISTNSKPKSIPSSSSQKKQSFWNWKPFKALSHIRQRRFDCVFSLHVHSIENLPSSLGDAELSVHWKRTSDPPSSATSTSSVHAFDGVAEFEETLTYRCSVYGARKNSSHPAARYEARHFLIYVSVSGSPEVDLGKHMVDVTRLLPLTLEELEDDVENRSGKWSTSFRLTGKGKGASLNVSFGFSLIDERTVLDTLNLRIRDEESVVKVRNKGRRWSRSQSVEDVRVLHEILPSSKSDASSLADTVEKLEIGNCEVREMCDLVVGSKPKSDDLCEEDEVKPKPHALPGHVEGHYLEEPEFVMIEQGLEISAKDQHYLEEPEFVMIEQGLEISAKDQLSAPIFEKIDLEGLDQGSQVVSREVEEKCEDNCDHKESGFLPDDNQTAIEGQDLVSDVLSSSEPEGLEAVLSKTMSPNPTSHTDVRSEYDEASLQSMPFGFDDTTDAVASEFLDMLGIDHSPFGLSSESDAESPRERLWKQFEEETLGAGRTLFGLDIETELDDDPWKEHDLSDDSEDFDISSLVREAEKELHEATQGLSHYSRAKLLEDAETEALMSKWGLSEKAFQCSPPGSSNGFGSAIDLPSEVPLKLPPLGEGLGPFVQTKDGGFLRSMSPSIFNNSMNNATLIMQVSSPVVVPAEMGSSIMEILERLASVGIEKLSEQAKKLMPLQDVTGKTMQQISWEATSALEACKRSDELPQPNCEADVVISREVSGRRKEENFNLASSSASDRDSEYVSVEDLAPLVMDKIEALSMEGLRIQSGFSDEDTPNISSKFIGNMSSLAGKGSDNGSLLGLEGTAGLQLLDVKGNVDDVDGLMSLSITLEEWMRLDSGIVDNEDQTSDRTAKILAAHRASSNLTTGDWKGERTGGKRSGRRCGLLGSNFTVALMVQLRDPLRNYDPVGTPMLALVQVERVFVPPKPKIYTTVSEKGNFEEEDEAEPEHEPDTKTEPILVNEEKKEEEVFPQFKITEVRVAGLKTDSNKKNVWGNPMQQQSGSRWLLANGMGKGRKHQFMKSKPVSNSSPVITAVLPGDALWSISSHVHGTGSKWK